MVAGEGQGQVAIQGDAAAGEDQGETKGELIDGDRYYHGRVRAGLGTNF